MNDDYDNIKIGDIIAVSTKNTVLTFIYVVLSVKEIGDIKELDVWGMSDSYGCKPIATRRIMYKLEFLTSYSYNVRIIV